MTLQQQGAKHFHSRQRSQSPKHNSQNRSIECRKQTTASQFTQKIINQSLMSSSFGKLPKLRLTEFTRDPKENERQKMALRCENQNAKRVVDHFLKRFASLVPKQFAGYKPKLS